jgi:hypothetical protein
MNDARLSIYDVEQCILTGKVVERQKDRTTGEWKYRIQGETIEDAPVELVAKFTVTGRLAIITVYLLW